MGTTKLLVTGIALRSVFLNSDPKFAYDPNQLAHDQDLQLRQDRKLMEEVSDQRTIQAGDNLRIITRNCPKKPSTDKGITEELMSYLESKKKYDSLMDGYMKGDELDSNMKELDSKMEIEKEGSKKSKARRKKSKRVFGLKDLKDRNSVNFDEESIDRYKLRETRIRIQN